MQLQSLNTLYAQLASSHVIIIVIFVCFSRVLEKVALHAGVHVSH